MAYTKTFVSAFAALMFVAGCNDLGSSDSALSDPSETSDCTLTQGYWKNHPDAWPVNSLTLGTKTYAKADLLVILKTEVKGNGLISLAHQLIAAKLNVAAGADDASIRASIAAADALIGSLEIGVDRLDTNLTSSIAGQLDAFNSGKTGPGHCGEQGNDNEGSDDHCTSGHCGDDQDSDSDSDSDNDENGDSDGDNDNDSDSCHGSEPPPPAPVCGDHKVDAGEECDDGNTTAHDGCSPTCTIEVPVCGNGVLETGEECDDGNTVNADGCSADCRCAC